MLGRVEKAIAAASPPESPSGSTGNQATQLSEMDREARVLRCREKKIFFFFSLEI